MDSFQISLAVSGGTLVTLILFIIKSSREYGALETKVNTMWAFQMRRAVSEVVTSGLGTINSPLLFNDLAKKSLEPIKGRLVEFYDTLPKPTSDVMALLKIEEIFGSQLLELVCIPCGLTHGACLLLALTVAKKANVVDIMI